jgi:hypothetical protein
VKQADVLKVLMGQVVELQHKVQRRKSLQGQASPAAASPKSAATSADEEAAGSERAHGDGVQQEAAPATHRASPDDKVS